MATQRVMTSMAEVWADAMAYREEEGIRAPYRGEMRSSRRCPDCGCRDMVATTDPDVIGCPACGWRERRDAR